MSFKDDYHITGSNVHIKAKNFDDAFKAIKKACGDQVEYGLDCSEAENLIDALKELGWYSIVQKGDIRRLWTEEYISCEGSQKALEALIPFVEHGSWIECKSEYDEIWRYVFRPDRIEEIYPSLTWPDMGF